MGNRKSLGKKTRFEVFKRDGFKCQYCGAHPPSVLLHVDHITAVADGGTNDFDNLITACAPCNLGKGARALDVAPMSLSQKAKEIAEREAQLAGYQEIFEAKRSRLEGETWRVLRAIYGENLKTVPLLDFNSTKRFIEALGVHEVLDAVDVALSAPARKPFRYFCGVCWNRIREQSGEPY